MLGPTFVVLTAVASVAVSAPGPKDVRKPTDPPTGDYVFEKLEDDGRVHKEDAYGPSDCTARFTSAKWIVFVGRFPVEERAEYHKNGDFLEIDLPDSGLQGIWKVDGDTLLLCFGAPGGDRPTEYTAPKDSKRSLWTLKRIAND
jgi:hypothetical protein